MRVLLDTHILLWGQAGDPALPKEAEMAIRSEGNEAWVSMVSFGRSASSTASASCLY